MTQELNFDDPGRVVEVGATWLVDITGISDDDDVIGISDDEKSISDDDIISDDDTISSISVVHTPL